MRGVGGGAVRAYDGGRSNVLSRANGFGDLGLMHASVVGAFLF